MNRNMSMFALACLLAMIPHGVDAVLPTGRLQVSTFPQGNTEGTPLTKETWFVSQASFGGVPPMDAAQAAQMKVVLAPDDNALLCDDVAAGSGLSDSDNDKDTLIMMMVPRGKCTFERKALNAQIMGAKGILVYGNLASRYSLNATVEEPTIADIEWPAPRYDYDCHKGHAMLPALDFSFDPLPYNAQKNDPLLSGETDSNLCHLFSDNQLRKCESKLCLLTGNKSSTGDEMEACCAWDLPVWLYNDPSMSDPNSPSYSSVRVNIPAAYLTMQQGKTVLDLLSRQAAAENGEDDAPVAVYVQLSSRARPSYNASSVLIWLLGVFVCAVAAYMSAADYRWSYRRHKALANAQNNGDRNSRDASRGGRTNRQQRPPTLTAQEDALELNPWHALGFIFMASCGLMVLFFFKIYSVVKIMYTIGCSSAMVQVIFGPIFAKIARKIKFKDKIVLRTETEDLGDITVLDIISSVVGFGIGLSWLYISITVRHPDQITYYWVVQDIMGACMCIVFLNVIKLNSIKVASTLLIVAFLYDIFFVFVTPLIFHGESVMITVATSGGPPKGDPALCEKYPDERDCQGGDPLPMLLTMPRLFDYMGGASLLGLGDIVLPGLLLSFGARFDAAKELVAVVTRDSHAGATVASSCCSTYFAPLVVAYAVGLFMANMAVYLMRMGQPALLYLVPCTLGTMSFLGWRRNELSDLWDGPKILDVADKITYDGDLPNTSDASNEGRSDSAGDGDIESEDPLSNGAAGGDGDDAAEETADDTPLLSS